MTKFTEIQIWRKEMAKVKERYNIKDVTDTIYTVTQCFDGAGVKFEVCGSVRRGKASVGDCDIVVADIPKAMLAMLQSGIRYQAISKTAKKKFSFTLYGFQFDLYEATYNGWGAMTLFLTGSKEFNIATRAMAKQRGWTLNQYGLFEGSECIEDTERGILTALGLGWVEPRMR